MRRTHLLSPYKINPWSRESRSGRTRSIRRSVLDETGVRSRCSVTVTRPPSRAEISRNYRPAGGPPIGIAHFRPVALPETPLSVAP